MNIFLVGYYGFHNTGDEVCCEKAAQFLKSAFSPVRLCILSGDPDAVAGSVPPFKNSALFGENTYCPRKFRSIVSTLLKSDMVVFGGGGLLQNATSSRSLFFYLGILILAKLLFKEVLLISQGIGPITGWFSRRVTRFVCNRVNGISCRDQASLTQLADMGVNRGRLILAADLAFYNTRPIAHPNPRSEAVGLSLRAFPFTASQIEGLAQFFKSLGETIVFQEYHTYEDRKIISLFEGLEQNITHFASMQRDFSKRLPDESYMKCVIAMRYHACIWCALNGIPFIALSYDPKVQAIAQECGQEYLDLHDPNAVTQLPDRYTAMLTRLPEYRQRIESSAKTLEYRAGLNMKLVTLFSRF